MTIPRDRTVEVEQLEQELDNAVLVFVNQKRVLAPVRFHLGENWCDVVVIKKDDPEGLLNGTAKPKALSAIHQVKRLTGTIDVAIWEATEESS